MPYKITITELILSGDGTVSATQEVFSQTVSAVSIPAIFAAVNPTAKSKRKSSKAAKREAELANAVNRNSDSIRAQMATKLPG